MTRRERVHWLRKYIKDNAPDTLILCVSGFNVSVNGALVTHITTKNHFGKSRIHVWAGHPENDDYAEEIMDRDKGRAIDMLQPRIEIDNIF